MLEQKIADLIAAVETLTATIAAQGVVSKTDTPASPKADNPTEAKTDAPSAQDLKDATLKAARSGHKDAIRDKLSGFGVTKIQDLGSADAAEFYGWVIGLDAGE